MQLTRRQIGKGGMVLAALGLGMPAIGARATRDGSPLEVVRIEAVRVALGRRGLRCRERGRVGSGGAGWGVRMVVHPRG